MRVFSSPPAISPSRPGRPFRCRGWAMGSGGRRIVLVEVSPNAGAEWKAARIAAPGSPWTWSIWKARPRPGAGTGGGGAGERHVGRDPAGRMWLHGT